MSVRSISSDFVTFIENNVKENPGKASLKLNVIEPLENIGVTLFSNNSGITLNDELTDYLMNNPDVEVKVGLG